MSRIHRGITYATNRDRWIENYLQALESWGRRSGELKPIVLYHTQQAWAAYGQFRVTGEPRFRWGAWAAIQEATAMLANGPAFRT
jgi:hypothetical protein